MTCPVMWLPIRNGIAANNQQVPVNVSKKTFQLEFARKHKGALAALATRGYLLGRSALSWLAALAKGNTGDRQIAGEILSRMLRP